MLIKLFGVLTLNLSCKLRNQAEHYAQRFLLHFLQPNLYQGCCIFLSQCRENALHHEQATCWDHLDSCKQRKDLITNPCSKIEDEGEGGEGEEEEDDDEKEEEKEEGKDEEKKEKKKKEKEEEEEKKEKDKVKEKEEEEKEKIE